MSLLKVSDLEGLNYEQLSGNENFKQALFEVSNPVSGETSSIWSYKSQSIRAYDFSKWVFNAVSSFDNTIGFLNSLSISGNICCNTEAQSDNDFFGKVCFGDYLDIKSNQISASASNSITVKSPAFDLYDANSNKLAYSKTNTVGLCVDVNMNGNRVQNIAMPGGDNDAVPKRYLGNFASCEYVLTDSVPSKTTMDSADRPTFYFVVQPVEPV